MDRRSFLKSVAAGAVVLQSPALVENVAQAETPLAPAGEEPRAETSLLHWVNLLQGTRSSYQFSRGNTLPIAALPFGMAHWTLQSNGSTRWFFHPDDRRLEGIRNTHQLSPWLSDYGQAVFMPINSTADPQPAARSSSFRPENATLTPAEFSLRLLRYRAVLQLTPSVRGASLLITFDDAQSNAGLAIDLPGEDAELSLDAATQTLHGSTSATSGGTPAGFRTFYCMRFGRPGQHVPLKLERHTAHGISTFVVRFQAFAGEPNAVQIGTSFISAEQARHNLASELGQRSFAQQRTEAVAEWSRHLERIQVSGGTDTQRRVLYSAMYRALLFPRTWHEVDASGHIVHYSAFNGKVEPGVMYADHGYWDVYRAWYPWMSIMFPERLGEILQAWVNAAHEGGWLPQFPSPGYRACMTGSLIDAVFADAAVKTVPGFDLPAAYAALRKHATTPGNPEAGYGRRGLKEYLALGYCPEGVIDQSAAETVDGAYGDFCIAQIAELLGKSDDHAMFLRRSENWRHLFDSETGFLRGKTQAGAWVSPFDPIRWGSPYVEGAAWQHRWDVPHQLDALFAAMGGPDKAVEHLEMMLTMPADFDTGAYRQEIHEMSEMAAANFGQYAHSNQPVHHVLYLFALAGRPDRTQYWARRVMDELYTPDTYAGDEDTGSMAAWFLLSACGFYPVCPGKPEYVIGTPLFPSMVLTVAGDKKLHITASGSVASSPYVRQVELNGAVCTKPVLSHASLISGGSLTFVMSERPVSATAAKPS